MLGATAPADAQAAHVAASARACTGAAVPGAQGVYAGSANVGGVHAFSTGTGLKLAIASDYLPRSSGWAGMNDIGWLLKRWRGSGCTLALGVPMIPNNGNGSAVGTLAAGAAGAYNAQFATLARTLVAWGQPHALLRLGWEFNGNWFPWQVRNTTDAANFAKFWRNIVTVMRAVHGSSFQYVWDPNDSGSFGSAYLPVQAYPGNAYVTTIADDAYDQCWCSPQTSANAWNTNYNQAWGLKWLVQFAASEGKPIALPEWAESVRPDGHGLGDDPGYVYDMARFMATNHVLWASYFDFNASDGQHDIFDSTFSKALRELRAIARL
jgi:hypothetical protein